MKDYIENEFLKEDMKQAVRCSGRDCGNCEQECEMKEEEKKYPVNIRAGNEFVRKIKSFVQNTRNSAVITDIGPFAGAYSLKNFGNKKYALVASADGAGTLTSIGKHFGNYSVIGESIVNHCINDILTVGAEPLFFLDYLASSTMSVNRFAEIVEGMSRAAKKAGCAILGGETAEMPSVYKESEFDVVGFIVGIVEREKMITGENISNGDLLIGLPSSGLHTNGYSLVNKLIQSREIVFPVTKDLYEVHRCYRSRLAYPINAGIIEGMAHITGGGFDNISRIMPDGLTFGIKMSSWHIPEIFLRIQKAGNVSHDEMFEVFNMGIGMVLIVKPENLDKLMRFIGVNSWYLIGHVYPGEKGTWSII
jgi:phosphoribosylformylglycinamidine cyclo-ligase